MLDPQPAACPLDVRLPRRRESLVHPLRAPVLRALLEASRGEAESGIGAGEGIGAAQIALVGDAESGAVLQIVPPVARNGTPNLGVAGDIHVDGRIPLD